MVGSRNGLRRDGAEVDLNPGAERVLHLLQLAGKEVIRVLHHHQFRRRERRGYHGFHFRLRSEFILRTADEELGLAAAGEKPIAILTVAGPDWKSQRCDTL